MKRFLVLPFLLVFIVCNASSQSFHWAKQAGGSGYDFGTAIAVDTAGNAYVTGSFQNTISFPGCTSLVAGTIGHTIFVAKFNSVGNCLWARKVSSNGNDGGNSIGVDSAGNVYITGIVNGPTVSFASTMSISASSDDGFVAKYNAAGTPQWALRIGGPGLQYGSGIAVRAASGNFYVTGLFENATVFNTTIGSPTTLTSIGPPPQPSPFLALGDIFLASYNSNGVLQWVKSAGGNKADGGFAVAVDFQNNAYVAGNFSSAFIWGGNALTPLGLFDGFLTKYSPSGNVLWVRTMSGPNQQRVNSISVDSTTAWYDGPYVMGSFSNSLSFSNSTTSLTSPFPNTLGNNNEVFFARYNAGGQLLWARRVGGPTNDYSGGICVRHSTPYIIGSFTGTATFGSQSLTSAGGFDIFVARYTSAGGLMWVRKAGGAQNDEGAGIGALISGRSYITGLYRSNPAGFPTSGNLTNANTATPNFFLAEIH